MDIIKLSLVINLIATLLNVSCLVFIIYDTKPKNQKTKHIKNVWECPVCHSITFNGEHHYCTFCRKRMRRVK